MITDAAKHIARIGVYMLLANELSEYALAYWEQGFDTAVAELREGAHQWL